jgi:hypothetical protein
VRVGTGGCGGSSSLCCCLDLSSEQGTRGMKRAELGLGKRIYCARRREEGVGSWSCAVGGVRVVPVGEESGGADEEASGALSVVPVRRSPRAERAVGLCRVARDGSRHSRARQGNDLWSVR